MSEHGQRRIAKFPSQSPIHNPSNPMHQLLDALGIYDDYLEDLFYKYQEKMNISTNISAEDESQEDYILGFHMLNLDGESYNIPRFPNESNNDYRARILSFLDNEGTLSSLRRIISNFVGIDESLIEIIETTESYFSVGDKLDSRIENVESNPLISRITNIVHYLIIFIPEEYDVSSLADALKNCVFANVQISINPEEPVTADVIFNIADEDDNPIEGVEIEYYY